MKSSTRLVPDWGTLIARGGKGVPLLSYPGLQSRMLLEGIREITVEGWETGLDWTCCGLYAVRVNGGGLESEEPVPPARSVTASLGTISPWSGLEALGEWMGGSLQEALTSPLAWPNVSPLMINGDNGPPGCLRYEEHALIPPSTLPSLRPVRPTRCQRPVPGQEGETRLGPFRLSIRGRRASRGVYVLGGECEGVVWRDMLRLQGACTVRIASPFYDYALEALYPGVYRYSHVRGGFQGEYHAVSIGLSSRLALASRTGFGLRISPGLLEVEVRGSLVAGIGGPLAAYRILLEDLVEWRTVASPRHGYGNARCSRCGFAVVDAGEGFLVFTVSNPLREAGVLEMRLPFTGTGVRVSGPFGETRIPVEVDIFRVPVAEGFTGYGIVSMGGKKLLSMMRSRFRS